MRAMSARRSRAPRHSAKPVSAITTPTRASDAATVRRIGRVASSMMAVVERERGRRVGGAALTAATTCFGCERRPAAASAVAVDASPSSPATTRNSTAGPLAPKPITSPSRSTRSPSRRCPLTYVPFLLPRSCSTNPSGRAMIAAWRDDTSRSRSASKRTSERG